MCQDVKDWLQPKCRAYRALLVPRPKTRRNAQWEVDKLASSGRFGRDEAIEAEIPNPSGLTEKELAVELEEKGRKLAGFAVQHGLSHDLGHQIQQDFKQIGPVLAKLVPTTKCMHLKLDLMGVSTCSRWHRDRYVGRAVVAYNGNGTPFVANDDVDLIALENGQKNEDIVPDLAKTLSTNVGDVLFMKGTEFPTSPNGLVHRSPEVRYHVDGSVMYRLLLKVDLN